MSADSMSLSKFGRFQKGEEEEGTMTSIDENDGL